MSKDRRRIGFFGGSFDPVHGGHLAMAESALEALSLDQVVFVPAARNPHKTVVPAATAEERVDMLRLATAGDARYRIWEGELDRAGPSYTYDTVLHLEQVNPNAHLFWIIGSDQCRCLTRWHAIEALVSRVAFILVRRPGYPLEWPDVPGLKIFLVDNKEYEVSSTALRAALLAGEPTPFLPTAVRAYIEERKLYQTG